MEEKKLRSGFTTGTCAAAAAKGAALLLVSGRNPGMVEITTPKGIVAAMPLLDVAFDETGAVCGVRKDAGDDPDVTDKTMVYASVHFLNGKQPEESWYGSEEYPGLWLAGGEGIGVVTLAGLSCPVGKPAINPVPRRMIFEAVAQVLEESGETGPAVVTISIPDGVRLAEKTFNPKLGIVGGISGLGTSGIVEPMSEAALLATIRLELHMKAAAGKRMAVLAPGNYGLNFLDEEFGIGPESVVKCSNFIADSMKMAAEEGFQNILLVGHAGKLIKAAGGAGNTHSAYGDNRMETMAGLVRRVLENDVQSLKGPGGQEASRNAETCALLEQEISRANTTEEAIGILRRSGLDSQVMTLAAIQLKDRLEQWAGNQLSAEVVIFSSIYGIVGSTEGAGALADEAGDCCQKRKAGV